MTRGAEAKMKLRAFCVLGILLSALTGSASADPFHLRCEYLENPLGIDKTSPQLSWQSDNTERNWEQAAYQILVASSLEQLRAGKTDVWDSGRIKSSESVGIAYGGPKLETRRRYYWKVRVWDTQGRPADSSDTALWGMGLVSPPQCEASGHQLEHSRTDAD